MKKLKYIFVHFSYYKMNKDKIRGMILGHALGDGPVEFPPFPQYTGVLNTPIKRYSRFHGHQQSSVGQITDDTEMAIAVLNTLEIGYSKENAIHEYMNWANNQNLKGNAPFMGDNTRKLFIIGGKSKPSVNIYNSRFEKQFPTSAKKENAKSNGAMMRAYPLVFSEKESIKQDVFLTNPSDFVYNIVEIYTTALRLAIDGKCKEIIKSRVRKLIRHDEITAAYNQACDNKFRDVTKQRGFVLHAFYCTFWALFNFDDYKTAIDSIITLGPNEDEKAKIKVILNDPIGIL
jgi:ADP-ribosylglycohydrolase